MDKTSAIGNRLFLLLRLFALKKLSMIAVLKELITFIRNSRNIKCMPLISCAAFEPSGPAPTITISSIMDYLFQTE
ncbi:hypothetical protein [Peribacillus frigoritolerans]|uniref:hypothetical protein n=1 Tax=Peribacillus frigoritolerans TaxID=450367 RepID=UPI0039A17E4B